MALGACSKDVEDSIERKVQGATKLIDVELSAGAPREDLRLAQTIDPTSGKATTPLMTDKNLEIVVSVAADGASPVQQTLVFTKVPGENRATYKGQLKVPNAGANSYKLTAILLGEVGGEKFTTLNSDGTVSVTPITTLTTAQNNTLQTKIPYVAEETSAQLDATGRVM